LTYSWADLDALVGGLPRSAYVHSAFWKGARSGWPGFTTVNVRVGEEVTFVRDGSALPARKGSASTQPVPQGSSAAPADLILIACVKQKLDHPAPARDLYTSDLFRKEREYAVRSGVPWFVLSAKHGLVDPDERLEPYDLHLAKTPAAYRDSWGARVVRQLEGLESPLDGKVIELHAGAAYADAIRDRLVGRGAQVREPLQGLRLGPRLAWYRRTLAVDKPTSDVNGPPHINPQDFLEALTDSGRAQNPAELLERNGTGLRSPGLYSWWVDEGGAVDLADGLGFDVRPGLIYAGLAGATRSRSGLKSKNTLWGRIRGMHLGGRHEFSTFRLSLGSILASARDEADIVEDKLTAWMHQHLRVLAIPFEDADTLAELESDVLRALDPPLNLDKVAKNPLRARLSELRRQYSRKKRSG
jgi:hypothetical protein